MLEDIASGQTETGPEEGGYHKFHENVHLGTPGMMAPEGSTTSLMLVTWQAGMLPGMYRVIVMATDEIQSVHQELISSGIDFELPPTETPRGTQAMFRDPFGNPLMLWKRAAEHHWDVPAEEPAVGQV